MIINYKEFEEIPPWIVLRVPPLRRKTIEGVTIFKLKFKEF